MSDFVMTENQDFIENKKIETSTTVVVVIILHPCYFHWLKVNQY